jgi:uncharacterized protein
MSGLFIIGGIFSFIGMFLSGRLKSKFEQYSQVGLSNHLSGREIAEQMLRHYGIYDVKVQLAEGFLSDHYNPADKTVNLSEMVYNGKSVASAAVSAHECGHAVQHATSYSMLKMRSAIVPAVKISTNIQQFLLPVALMMASGAMGGTILLITILLYGVTTAFSLITLPVEFDASRRALVWLESSGNTVQQEQAGAKDALWWAAMTYVCAALAALVSLLYLIMQYQRRSNN